MTKREREKKLSLDTYIKEKVEHYFPEGKDTIGKEEFIEAIGGLFSDYYEEVYRKLQAGAYISAGGLLDKFTDFVLETEAEGVSAGYYKALLEEGQLLDTVEALKTGSIIS